MGVLSKFDLGGRTAMVTGASRGLGRAMALALAEAGADIVGIGRDGEAAAVAAQEIEATGRRNLTLLGDITQRAEVQRMTDEAVAQFGRIDILINNAGACVHAPALEVTDEDWHAVMDVNVNALWLCSQIVGKHMISQGGGTIVNIGSMSGAIVNRPQWQPAYNASKAAVHHLTRSLAAEWAPMGIRVNALAPGYVKTDMSPVDDPKYRRFWIQDAPMQRYATPDELGPAVVFLAGEASSFVTGSVLTMDGGYSVF